MASADRGSSLLLDDYFASGDPRFLDELYRFDGDKKLAVFAARWYQDKRPFARSALLTYIDDGCDRPSHRPLVKRLFKAAEAAGDDEAMGHFLAAFDRIERRELVEVERYDWNTREPYLDFQLRVVPRPPVITVDAKGREQRRYDTQFSSETRRYLKRRAWRYFRRLGFRERARYGRAIRAALRLYRDEHLSKPEHVLDAWGLVHALYWGSPVLVRDREGVRLAPGRSLAELRPAPIHPKAWESCFDDLLALVGQAGCRPVRAFAMARLRDHDSDALRGLPIARLRPLLRSPHEDVQVFGAELLRNASGLELLPVAEWLELLRIDNPTALPLVCELVARHVSPERLTLEACVELACARPAPVAELGLRWVRARVDAQGGDLQKLLSLGGAEAPRVRAEAAAWLIERLAAAPDAKPEHLRELVDARHADVRERALRTLDAEGRFRDSTTLWSALPESPYDDVRAFLVAHLERRAASYPGGSLLHVWATALLAVHRGGRSKPLVARQIAERIVRHPDEAETLLPLLGIALRGLRAPERRAALAAVTVAAARLPSLAQAIAVHLPELKVQDAAAAVIASQGRAVAGAPVAAAAAGGTAVPGDNRGGRP